MPAGDSGVIPGNSDDGNAGSNYATQHLLLTAVGNPTSESRFEHHDGLTLLVAAAIYARKQT
jgi:hypothetical protein